MTLAIKKIIITGGALFFGGPAIGLLGTVVGMMRSFHTLGAAGVADPTKLSSDISITLISTAVGLAVGLIGLVTVLAGIGIWLVDRNKEMPQNENLS